MQRFQNRRTAVRSQLVGASLFNQALGHLLTTLYGCVTTADQWLLRLTDRQLTIDNRKYALSHLETLPGIFNFILRTYRQRLGDDQTVAKLLPAYQSSGLVKRLPR